MSRKIGLLVLVIALVIPAAAAGKPGAISGYVRDATGVPEELGLNVGLFDITELERRAGFVKRDQGLPGVR